MFECFCYIVQLGKPTKQVDMIYNAQILAAKIKNLFKLVDKSQQKILLPLIKGMLLHFCQVCSKSVCSIARSASFTTIGVLGVQINAHS